MPATKIAIFISTESKMLRGVLVPDNDEQLALCHAPIGETMLIVPAFSGRLDPANLQYVIDKVFELTGVTPPNPTCAVVDSTNTVVDLICADEAIDAILGKTLVQVYDPEITQGCTFDRRTREFTVPPRTIPARLDRFGLPVPEQTLPAKRLTRLRG